MGDPGAMGAAGAQGPQGPTGPAGDAGASVRVQRFTGSQGTCANGGVSLSVIGSAQVEYVCDAPRFRTWTFSSQRVVFDEQTGRMWQRDATSVMGFGPFTQPAAIAYCDGLVYAGFIDWRLPDQPSLATLIQLGQTPVAPTIDRTVFENTPGTFPAALFWTDELNSGDAVAVNFENGNAYNLLSTGGPHSVRCVR